MADQIHFRHRRRGVRPRQGHLRGVARAPFEAARPAGHATRNSTPTCNVDPGTMSPYQHGEVFVTEDGAETDLDLGHYERFVDDKLDGNASVSSGKVFWSGPQPGATAATISAARCRSSPTSPMRSKSRIYAMEDGGTDVVISEIGGTVGDIESQPFLEAIRQVARGKGPGKCPVYPRPADRVHPGQRGAQKQAHPAFRQGAFVGRHPAGYPGLPQPTRRSARTSAARSPCSATSRNPNCVIPNADRAASSMRCPLHAASRRALANAVCRRLGLPATEPDLTRMVRRWSQRIKNCPQNTVDHRAGGQIYRRCTTPISAWSEALLHAGIANDAEVDHPLGGLARPLHRRKRRGSASRRAAAIMVPGGFGDRGIEGMISAVQLCQRKERPVFRHLPRDADGGCRVCPQHGGMLGGAAFRRVPRQDRSYPVIDLHAGAGGRRPPKGGTMRLGRLPLHACRGQQSLAKLLRRAERSASATATAMSSTTTIREALTESGPGACGHLARTAGWWRSSSCPSHPWFVGVQFHPEFKSRPNRSHPLFFGFVRAALAKKESAE